ncbi:MAG: WYL domain-containing protein [Desulfosoma sp.]
MYSSWHFRRLSDPKAGRRRGWDGFFLKAKPFPPESRTRKGLFGKGTHHRRAGRRHSGEEKERVRPWECAWEEAEDGSLLFHLKTSGYQDVKRWVLSFGRDARVLEPERLRRDLAAIYRNMARQYAEAADMVRP